MTVEELRAIYPDYKVIYRKNQHYHYIQLEKIFTKKEPSYTLADELKNLALQLETSAP